MVAQIKHLTLLQLRNLFGINTVLYTKDTKKKNASKAIMAVGAFALLVLCGYVCGLVYGYVYLGMEKVVPAYLVLICSVVVLAMGIFKAGAVIFSRNSYDILSAMPIHKTAIVFSRFLRMYVEYILFCALVMVPGMITYGVLCKPDILFYVIGIINVFLSPLLPMGAATLLGAVVTWISSRMKRKSLVSSVLTILFAVGILSLSMSAGKLENVSMEELGQFAEMVTKLIESIYPIAIWLGGAMVGGSIIKFLLGALLSFTAAVLVIAVVSVGFHSVMQRLHGSSAKHDYRMEELQSSHFMLALCKKEFKRYFASSIYVTNTIMGPIMGLLLSAAFLFADVDTIMAELQLTNLPMNLNFLIPVLVGGTFSMMLPVCVSLSMEGKNYWITKTLPLPAKTVYDSKMLMNLLLVLPFYVLSEICLFIGLKPTPGEGLAFVLIPALMIMFVCVFGIRANLWLHSFDWTDEVKIVKQSSTAAIGGFAGILLMFVIGIGVVLVSLLFPGKDTVITITVLVICILLALVTFLLYQANAKRELP